MQHPSNYQPPATSTGYNKQHYQETPPLVWHSAAANHSTGTMGADFNSRKTGCRDFPWGAYNQETPHLPGKPFPSASSHASVHYRREDYSTLGTPSHGTNSHAGYYMRAAPFHGTHNPAGFYGAHPAGGGQPTASNGASAWQRGEGMPSQSTYSHAGFCDSHHHSHPRTYNASQSDNSTSTQGDFYFPLPPQRGASASDIRKPNSLFKVNKQSTSLSTWFGLSTPSRPAPQSVCTHLAGGNAPVNGNHYEASRQDISSRVSSAGDNLSPAGDSPTSTLNSTTKVAPPTVTPTVYGTVTPTVYGNPKMPSAGKLPRKDMSSSALAKSWMLRGRRHINTTGECQSLTGRAVGDISPMPPAGASVATLVNEKLEGGGSHCP